MIFIGVCSQRDSGVVPFERAGLEKNLNHLEGHSSGTSILQRRSLQPSGSEMNKIFSCFAKS